MFNAYSDEAKAVIGEAEKGARAMGHKLVGTEHILLAFFSAIMTLPWRGSC